MHELILYCDAHCCCYELITPTKFDSTKRLSLEFRYENLNGCLKIILYEGINGFKDKDIYSSLKYYIKTYEIVEDISLKISSFFKFPKTPIDNVIELIIDDEYNSISTHNINRKLIESFPNLKSLVLMGSYNVIGEFPEITSLYSDYCDTEKFPNLEIVGTLEESKDSFLNTYEEKNIRKIYSFYIGKIYLYSVKYLSPMIKFAGKVK